jgi:hypothetical protein
VQQKRVQQAVEEEKAQQVVGFHVGIAFSVKNVPLRTRTIPTPEETYVTVRSTTPATSNYGQSAFNVQLSAKRGSNNCTQVFTICAKGARGNRAASIPPP